MDRMMMLSARKCPVVLCKQRKKELPLVECVDSYVNANAIPNRRSACYRCMQGQRTRSEYSQSCTVRQEDNQCTAARCRCHRSQPQLRRLP